MMGRHTKSERQAELNQFTRELIAQCVINGPPRDFEQLTRGEQKLVKTYERAALVHCRNMTTSELIWGLIWGTASGLILTWMTGAHAGTNRLHARSRFSCRQSY